MAVGANGRIQRVELQAKGSERWGSSLRKRVPGRTNADPRSHAKSARLRFAAFGQVFSILNGNREPLNNGQYALFRISSRIQAC